MDLEIYASLKIKPVLQVIKMMAELFNCVFLRIRFVTGDLKMMAEETFAFLERIFVILDLKMMVEEFTRVFLKLKIVIRVTKIMVLAAHVLIDVKTVSMDLKMMGADFYVYRSIKPVHLGIKTMED